MKKAFKSALKHYIHDDVNQNDSREESFTSGWNSALKWASENSKVKYISATSAIVDQKSILKGNQQHYYDPK